jgi:hypothetical protein
MEIFNTDTNETEEITYLCDGQDMFGEISQSDPDIEWNNQEERMEAPGKTVKWWNRYVISLSDADDLEKSAKKVLSWQQEESLNEEIQQAATGDFDFEPEQRMETICQYMKATGFKLKGFLGQGIKGYYFEANQ